MNLTIKTLQAEETWPLRHRVMWPNMPREFVILPEDAEGHHFGLFVNDRLLSVLSLFQTAEGVAQFRKFATLVEEQGKGYGSKLLAYTIAFAKSEGYHTLWCNARVDKTDFYKRFGMYETQETFVKQKQKFVILEKVL